MENTNGTHKQSPSDGKHHVTRSARFWVSLITFLMLFGLLLTGVVISVFRLIRMLTG
jgi:hypothetical protein